MDMEIDLTAHSEDINHLHDIQNGRDIGEKLGVLAMFERVKLTDTKITLIIPNSVYGVSTSFVNGFFGNTVQQLGKETVLNHLLIDADDHIVLRIIDALERATVKQAEPLQAA